MVFHYLTRHCRQYCLRTDILHMALAKQTLVSALLIALVGTGTNNRCKTATAEVDLAHSSQSACERTVRKLPLLI